MEQTKPKAKRKLKSLDFSGAGAAVALVGPSVGGPANGIPVLTIKGVNWTDEQVQKATKIRVTMEIKEFLRVFYGLYYEDSEILARALGFDTSKEDMEENDMPQTYEDYITSRVEAIEVLKALHEAENIPEVLSSITPDEYLAMLESQAKLEAVFKQIDKQKNSAVAPVAAADEGSTEAVAKAEQSDEKTEAKVEPSETVNKGKSMTKEVKAVDTVEMVEKSALETIQKQMEDQKVELQKALDVIKAFEAEKKEAIVKSKTAAVTAVVKNKDHAAIIAKAALALESEADFEALVNVVKEMQELVEKSSLFVEQGVSDEPAEQVQKSALDRMIEAKYKKV